MKPLADPAAERRTKSQAHKPVANSQWHSVRELAAKTRAALCRNRRNTPVAGFSRGAARVHQPRLMAMGSREPADPGFRVWSSDRVEVPNSRRETRSPRAANFKDIDYLHLTFVHSESS